jgi:hypothetical protein
MRPLLIEHNPNVATVTADRRRAKRAGAELPQAGNVGPGNRFPNA